MQAAANSGVSPTTPEDFRPGARFGGFSWREVFLLALVSVLAWVAITVNLSDYFAQEGTPEGARQALTWSRKHPGALIDLALEPAASDNILAYKRLRDAAAAQPAEGRLYAALAQYADAQKASELAIKAMQQAVELAPQRTDVRLTAWQFWLRKNDPVSALQAANVILNRNPELGEKLFPLFLRLMAHPRSDEAFASLLRSPIRWWPAFFQFVSYQAPNADVLRVLYSMQLQGPNPVEETQLRIYLTRLQNDGHWLDAYLIWLDSLPKEALAFDSELHNGGFEYATRNLGFEWIDQPVQGVLVGFDPTYGTTGARALHVVFQGLPAYWRHFNQYLMLPPGEYGLRGRARVDSLKAERGVQWTMTCFGKAEPLASTERYKGSAEWSHFVVAFTVPESGCDVQDLRLELVGKAALDFVAEGQIWFDDLAITRK
ncbi:hypothetical protein [Propionivibrio sp.]|uniref:tetratricopeptide repeat protein n=1 Tax=Propionivibrio sp. TaxID=2212460 RepID=UPI0026301B92|nr:hypothetical protein [Propionivibrio sp.]